MPRRTPSRSEAPRQSTTIFEHDARFSGTLILPPDLTPTSSEPQGEMRTALFAGGSVPDSERLLTVTASPLVRPVRAQDVASATIRMGPWSRAEVRSADPTAATLASEGSAGGHPLLGRTIVRIEGKRLYIFQLLCVASQATWLTSAEEAVATFSPSLHEEAHAPSLVAVEVGGVLRVALPDAWPSGSMGDDARGKWVVAAERKSPESVSPPQTRAHLRVKVIARRDGRTLDGELQLLLDDLRDASITLGDEREPVPIDANAPWVMLHLSRQWIASVPGAEEPRELSIIGVEFAGGFCFVALLCPALSPDQDIVEWAGDRCVLYDTVSFLAPLN